MNENEELLKKRFIELLKRAESGTYYVFSDFLNLDEISILLKSGIKDVKLFGGYNGADRCIASFGNFSFDSEYPISIIEIKPKSKKFSDDLTHRDFLGSVLSLGIERKTVGDIIINDNVGYLFCLEKVKDVIIDNLKSVRHTAVTLSEYSYEFDFKTELPEKKKFIVSSSRCDVIISEVYNLSRSKTSILFSSGRVFINSRQASSLSKNLFVGDTISVRKMGKFIYEGEVSRTKKDRLIVEIRIYK